MDLQSKRLARCLKGDKVKSFEFVTRGNKMDDSEDHSVSANNSDSESNHSANDSDDSSSDSNCSNSSVGSSGSANSSSSDSNTDDNGATETDALKCRQKKVRKDRAAKLRSITYTPFVINDNINNSDKDINIIDQTIKFSTKDVICLYGMVPYFRNYTKSGLNMLKLATENMYSYMSCLFGLHLAIYGICSASNVICEQHLIGFRSQHLHWFALNNQNIMMPILTNKLMSIQNLIFHKARQFSERNHVKTLKFESRTVLKHFANLINLAILKRFEFIGYYTKDDVRQNISCVAEFFAETINELLSSEECSDWNNKLTEENTYFAAEHQSRKRVASQSSIEDTNKPNDAQTSVLSENTSGIATDFTNIDDESPDVPIKKIKTKAPKTLVSIDTIPKNTNPYLCVPEKVSPVKCVMCNKSRTYKTIDIGSDIRVACCSCCRKKLTSDYNSVTPAYDHESIINRIVCQYKTPIAFDNDGNFITTENVDTTPARNFYNRKLPKKDQQTIKKQIYKRNNYGSSSAAASSSASSSPILKFSVVLPDLNRPWGSKEYRQKVADNIRAILYD